MIRKLLSYLLTAPLLLAAACISEEVTECPDTEGKDMVLSLKIDMGLDATTSRTDKGDEEGYADPSGDFEKISSLRVIILNDYSEVEGARLVATNEEGYPIGDNLEFIVKANETKKIILIANESSLTAPEGSGKANVNEYLEQFMTKGTRISQTQLDELNGWTVSMPGRTNANPTRGLFSTAGNTYPSCGLPLTEMFQVYVSSELAAVTAENDTYKQEVTLFLTRAAAKATFQFHLGKPGEPSKSKYNGKGLYVTGIRLNGIDWTEYVFPKDTDYSPEKYEKTVDGINIPLFVKNAERYITSFAPVPNAAKSDFIFDISSGNAPVEIGSNIEKETRGPIYFPESMCDAKQKNYTVQVRVGTKEGNRWIYGENDGWITARDNNGTLEDNILNVDGRDAIARNTYLKIDIYFGEIEITCKATVLPYATQILNPEFGFSPPVTDKLTIAPSMDLVLNGADGFIFPKFESDAGNTIQNLYWISANPSIVRLGNRVTDETDQTYIEPAESIELPYLQMVQNKEEPVPVRVVPKGVGTTYVTVYTQSSLVARCKVTVKE